MRSYAEPVIAANALGRHASCEARVTPAGGRGWLLTFGKKMKAVDSQRDAIAQLTAALGGRRLYGLLWLWWLLFSIVVATGMSVARSDSATSHTTVALAVSSLGLLFATLSLLRVVRKEGRKELLTKQPESNASTLLKVLVWVLPMVGLGAILSPFIFR